jgi:hypothetical protein
MIDITGKKFGRWAVIEIAEKRPNRDNGTRIFWKCICECGNVRNIDGASLKSGHSKSCGCLRKEGHRTLPHGVSEQRLLLYSYRRNAERRNLDFFLSAEQFTNLTQKNCYYCGEMPKNKLTGKWFNGEYFYNGVDRFDNTKGYIVDNCVPCCETCNRAKRIMSADEFTEWIIKVYHNFAAPRINGVEWKIDIQDDETALWHRKQYEMKELGIPS